MLDRKQEKDIEFKVYQMMCASCPNERRCHVDCENCLEYELELEAALDEARKGGK